MRVSAPLVGLVRRNGNGRQLRNDNFIWDMVLPAVSPEAPVADRVGRVGVCTLHVGNTLAWLMIVSDGVLQLAPTQTSPKEQFAAAFQKAYDTSVDINRRLNLSPACPCPRPTTSFMFRIAALCCNV
jgi:hypothetical protein